jgi:hypothetical protein
MTIRLMIALSTKYNWNLHHTNIKSTFLNGELKEVYLIQPKGFVNKLQKHLLCRLNKELYGLKEAAKSWYIKNDNFFFQQVLIKVKSDPNLYIMKDEHVNVSLIS